MPGERPFFVEGKIVDILVSANLALVKVSNGNVYHLIPETPGIVFDKLRKDQRIILEVTIRVLSARLIET